MQSKFAGPLIKVVVLMAKIVLAPLASMTSASAMGGVTQRKICQRGVVREGKGVTLVILNEDLDVNIRITKSLENSGIICVELVNE